jgi:hypothetical protein
MEKQLTLEQFKTGVKFKIRNQYDPKVLSRETYYYKKITFNDMDPIESVKTMDMMIDDGGNIEKATKSSFTVYAWLLGKRVTSRIKFADCVIVEDED